MALSRAPRSGCRARSRPEGREGAGAQVGRAGGGAARGGSGIRVPASAAAAAAAWGRRPLAAAGGRMLGFAVRRRCPRGLRRGREALLVLLALLALAGLSSILRARRRAATAVAEPRPATPRGSSFSGRREPVLPRPPVPADALGARGEAVRLQLQGEELRLQEESVRKHQINIYLSDRISLHRRLPERWNPL